MRIELRINRELARALRLASGVVFLGLISAFACRLAFAADPPAGRPAKGIRAPIDYYPPPHQLQMRSFLEASESEMGSNGTTILRDAKLQMFREDGSKEMIVSAPSCLYDYVKEVVNSSGPMELQTWDENNKRAMQLKGSSGFYWQQTNSLLIVSNQQTTTISGPLTNSFTP
jgi:hypothetical protein